jgi:hypothetical protein
MNTFCSWLSVSGARHSEDLSRRFQKIHLSLRAKMRLSPISASWRTALRIAPLIAVVAIAAGCEDYPPTYTEPTPNPGQIQLSFRNGAVNVPFSVTVSSTTPAVTIHLPVSRDTSLNTQLAGIQVGGDTVNAIVLNPSGVADEGSTPARGYVIEFCTAGTWAPTSSTCTDGTANGIGAAGAAGSAISFVANPVSNFGGWFAVPAATAGTTFTVVLVGPNGQIVSSPNMGPFTITVISP